MTIAAGFVVRDGVVICSDSEHSVGGILTHESKLTPAEFTWGKAIFASSGNSDLAVAAIQICVQELQSMPNTGISSNTEAAKVIGQTINTEYRKHVSAQPDPNADSTYEILVAIWCEKDSAHQAALYKTWQGSIRRVPVYECIGSGYYLGRYVIESMAGSLLSESASDTDRARFVATNTLSIAKKFADGCGGNSHIATLKNDGTVIGLSATDTEPLEQALHLFNQHAFRMLSSVLTASDAGFSKALADFGKTMSLIRLELKLDDSSKEAAKQEAPFTSVPGQTPSLESTSSESQE